MNNVELNVKQVLYGAISLALTIVAIVTSATLPYSDVATKVMVFALLEAILVLPWTFVAIVFDELGKEK